MDFAYQKYTLDRIQHHDKSILVWFRQSGKSQFIIDTVIDYISKNTDKTIFIYSYRKLLSKNLQKRIHQQLKNKINTSYLSKISGCTIYFNNTFERKNQNSLFAYNPDFLIVDDFEFSDLKLLLHLIDNSKCKVILTSSIFSISDIVSFVDRKLNYYLSVVSLSSINNKELFEKRKWLVGNKFDMEHEYGDITKIYTKLGIKKDVKLIDVWGIKLQRRRKLEFINKINEKS